MNRHGSARALRDDAVTVQEKGVMVAEARIYITLKERILDPQGNAVLRALHSLGYDEVENLKVGKYMEMTLKADDRSSIRNKVTEMSEKLLANTVVEDYRIEVDP